MTCLRKSSPRLAMEELEPRWAPAGNVTAELAPHPRFGVPIVLSIVGDNEDNQIRIVEDGPDHAWIEGLNGTTVNGKASDDVFAAGDEFPWAEIMMGNGDDTVIYELTGDQWRHGIIIDTGNGNDSLTVSVNGIIGAMRIDTGVGDDSVTIELAAGSLLNSGLRVHTGAGKDHVVIRASTDGALPILAGPTNEIYTEQGDDIVQFEGRFATIGGLGLFVHLGEGDDTLIGDPESSLFPSAMEALGGSGHDTVLNASYFNPFRLHLFETIVND